MWPKPAASAARPAKRASSHTRHGTGAGELEWLEVTVLVDVLLPVRVAVALEEAVVLAVEVAVALADTLAVAVVVDVADGGVYVTSMFKKPNDPAAKSVAST